MEFFKTFDDLSTDELNIFDQALDFWSKADIITESVMLNKLLDSVSESEHETVTVQIKAETKRISEVKVEDVAKMRKTIEHIILRRTIEEAEGMILPSE